MQTHKSRNALYLTMDEKEDKGIEKKDVEGSLYFPKEI